MNDYLIYIVSGMGVAVVASWILLIVDTVKLRKMKRNLRVFMNGKTAENLEDSMVRNFARIDELERVTDDHGKSLSIINEKMLSVYSKLGIVKYDAFNEMGGKLSFALALLDESNNGYLINAMHSREGCYTYVKEIIKGESFITLGEEEKQALNQAMGIE